MVASDTNMNTFTDKSMIESRCFLKLKRKHNDQQYDYHKVIP